MRKFTLWIVLLFVTCVSVAQNDLLDLKAPKSLVTDLAQILNENEEQLLRNKLHAYNDSTSTQIAVVTIPSLHGYEIADYSFRLANKWGIGQKGKDNGVLILVSLEEHKMFIATGYGMEEILPDALAKRIVENYLKPNFREQNYYHGLDQATTVIIGLASGRFTADQIPNKNPENAPLLPLIVLVFLLVFFYIKYRADRSNGIKGTDSGFWYFLIFYILLSGGRRNRNGFGNFSSGRGGFGGFGGGGFGGGGAGGRW